MSVQKILLVLGGDPPSEDLLRWRIEESDLSVAVDSGWLAFRHAGLIPDILIGDMDSWQGVESDVPNSVEWIIEKDQEKTDFQKAIQWVLSCENPKELVVLGGLGKRSDHLLTNLFTICNLPEKVEVVMDSNREWIRRVTANKPLNIKGQQGASVSLFPGSPCIGVTSNGLKWDLDNNDLSFNKVWSQSNECSLNETNISLRIGCLLIILQK